MSAIVSFDSSKLPSSISAAAKLFGMSNDLASSPGGRFKVVSIKGKVFHIVDGDTKELVTKPGEDDPAASIEVVIVKANPNKSKVFYSGGFVEGSVEKPTCFSNDGVAPDAQSTEPQSKKCATCAHNQWGAKITSDGKKGKACADSKRLAIAPVGQLNDPMLLRVPGASLKALDAFQDQLSKRGVPYQIVQCKLSFDHSVAHPALLFKPVGIVADEGMLNTIKEMSESDTVKQIVGTMPMPRMIADTSDDNVPPPAPKPAAKPATKSAAMAAVDNAPAPSTKVSVDEDEETPAPKKAAAKPKVVEVADDEGLEAEINAMLTGAGFDDQ